MSKGIYIGLDIGGTKILAASATPDGHIQHKIRRETPLDLETGIALLKELVVELSVGKKLLSIGAAVGGPLDWKTGVVSPLHQPRWQKVPIKSIFESTFSCPFYVDVDTNVAAMGEYRHLPEKPSRLLYLTISTGVGGGFVVDGYIYRGSDGAHPEAGHHAIPFKCRFPGRVVCDCGGPDCLEALVSGTGIQRIFQKPAEALLPDEWEEVGYNLGRGLQNLAILHAPDVIVLGGGVAIGAGEKLLAPARKTLKKYLKYVPMPALQLSILGYESGLVSALSLARQPF